MLTQFLGKLFFPKLQPWERRRELKNIYLAVSVGLLLASLFVLIVCFKNSPGK